MPFLKEEIYYSTPALLEKNSLSYFKTKEKTELLHRDLFIDSR